MCWTLNANDALAARAARKAATQMLRAFTDDPGTLSDAELIIGELLSNAARHATGHVCLELGAFEGNAQISVHDTSSTFNLEMKRPSDQYAENGRGLFIVSELARSVSVIPRDGFGKRVTVTLDLALHGERPLDPSCSSVWLREADNVCLQPRTALYLRPLETPAPDTRL